MKPFAWPPAIQSGRGKLVLLVAAMAAAWWWLGRLEDGVAWLQVEAPRHAVGGVLLPLRIEVTGLPGPTCLCADLHWTNRRDTSNGFLASGGVKPVGPAGGQFDFEIRVRPTNDLRYVRGIIYLTPTGDWNDQTFAAATDLIPVTDGRHGGPSTWVRWPVHPLFNARAPANPPATLRRITGLMWLAASVVAGLVFRSQARSREKSSSELRWWLALAVGLALASGWEWFGLESRVGVLGRTWAHAEDVYALRAGFQKALISVAFAATLGFLAFGWRQRRTYQLTLIWLGLYLAVAFVNLLSFHPVDQYAGLSWHGITLIGALKIACAAATLKSVGQARQALQS